MNATLANLSSIAVTQFWQITAVCLLVALATRLLCRHRPHLAYLLWMLVIVKAITPPLVASPTGLFSWMNRSVTTQSVPQPAARPDVFAASDLSVDSEPQAAPTLDLAELPAATEQVQGIAGPAQRDWLPFAAVLAAIWLLGASGLSLVIVLKWLRLRRLWLAEVTAEQAALAAMATELARELAIRRRVRVVVSRAVDTPAVFGVGLPTILLPLDLVRQMPLESLRPVLAHELIHVRRGDLAVAIVQLVAQILWWFHPLVWWANREARRERERACDEEVVAGLGLKAGDYARSLLAVLEARDLRASLLPLPTIGMFGVTARRLEHLMRGPGRFHRRTPKAYYMLAVFALVLVLPGAGLKVAAQAPTPEQASTGKPADESPAEQPAPNQSPKGLEALAKLKALGAYWYDYGAGQAGALGGAGLGISFGPEWKGTAEGWKLLESLDHPEQLLIVVQTDRIDGLAEVHPAKPLATILLNFQGPEAWGTWLRVAAMALPACRSFVIEERESELTFGDYQALLALEPDAEELSFTGKAVQSRYANNPVLDRGAMETNNDVVAEVAQQMKHLRRLTVSEAISAGGLAALGKMTALERLIIRVAGVKPTDVEPLSHLTHLETLMVFPSNAATNMSDRSGEIPVGDAIVRAVAGLPKLKRLDVETQASSKGLGAIAAAKDLRSLGLQLADVSDADLAAIGKLTRLRSLRLSGSGKLSDAGLSPLEKMTRLTSLSLPADEITDAGLAHLKPLVALRYLTLWQGKSTGSGLAAIGRLPKLESLDLTGSAFDDAGCRVLPQLCPQLKSLTLSSTKVSDAGLESIARLPELYTVMLDQTGITDVGLAKLKPLTRLRQLRVVSTKVTPEGVAALKTAIPNLEVANENGNFWTSYSVIESLDDADDQPADEASPVDEKK